MGAFHTSERASNEWWEGRHRFEHWYRDNSVYFITARVRDQFRAFESERAKAIFWDRFDAAIAKHGFTPWVTSLMDNHYHTIGHLMIGEELPRMMRLIHGGVAKLVGDLLMSGTDGLQVRLPAGERIVPFWCDSRKRNYFDGCLRNEKQGRLTYRYVLTQAVRHGIVHDWRDYPHTHVNVDLEDAIKFALERGAFMQGVPYRRYDG